MSLVTDVTGHYARNYHKPMEHLANKLSECYAKDGKTIDVIVNPSGMNAIYTLMLSLQYRNSFSTKPTEVIYPTEIYCDVPRTFQWLELIQNPYKVGDHDEMMKLLEKKNDNPKILFVESASNPNSVMFDFLLMEKIKQLGVTVVVDNTWLTHLMCNPFDYGADFVVLSLTKYYSGGNVICGAILSDFGISHQLHQMRVDVMHDLKLYMARSGTHVSLHYCQIISDNLVGMQDRLTKSSALTEQVLAYLKENYKYKICHSPKINGLVCSIFTIYFSNNTRNKVIKMMKKNGILEYKTSYGGKLSRFDPFPYPYQSGGESGTVCRIAIGYEDTFENVKNGLDKFLQ